MRHKDPVWKNCRLWKERGKSQWPVRIRTVKPGVHVIHMLRLYFLGMRCSRKLFDHEA